ncbi:PP2C family protein-serine/threonine phosphatase [Streptomyces sp. AK02-01A]|uniref:PP2C family protein-serine/threonine phosphatase n=1 Tax=Streptomyces sp. AK02-01A TaxID=3028648 RepID=UPI0029B4BE3D|nr:SpoIIE family protein phosphatase [Streptomyces sp. AK02-01A]MDX3854496.1 SpoIIE family protein phosphatase [Streptomyces sp. AK02-01A]
MPSPLFADRPAPQSPERETVDALITQARRLRGDMDAVRRDTSVDDDDTLWRWQRALCELAVRQLDHLGAHLDQLRAGRPDSPTDLGQDAPSTHRRREPPALARPALGRVGSAEWDLLTDEVSWSDELYEIFGRPAESGPMSLDELPSLVFPDDQPVLTAMVTGCLIDGKPIDGEFRVLRPDGRVRTLHMLGEPVIDTGGCTASMWAVLRDISELRRSERAVRESGDSLRRAQHIATTERRLVTELQEALLPSWRGSLQLSGSGPAALDLAARYLPSVWSPPTGGDWYDVFELPSGETLLTVGDLTGHGMAAASSMAMLLGALRGMAVAGVEPGALLGHLSQLLDASEQPALGGVLCSRYTPATRTFTWAQAGHPAPLLFRDGTGRTLTPPDGVLLGAASGAAYEQAGVRLRPGDLLVLHTDGLTADGTTTEQDRLLALAPRLTGTRTAQQCATTVVEEFGEAERADDACVMVARVGG